MKSEELQHLTASEPLSLEEEYQMQRSWMIDENSLYLYIFFKYEELWKHACHHILCFSISKVQLKLNSTV